MITFLDIIQNNEFRDFVAKRIASSTGKTYTFPKTFPKLYRYRSLSKYLIPVMISYFDNPNDYHLVFKR